MEKMTPMMRVLSGRGITRRATLRISPAIPNPKTGNALWGVVKYVSV